MKWKSSAWHECMKKKQPLRNSVAYWCFRNVHLVYFERETIGSLRSHVLPWQPEVFQRTLMERWWNRYRDISMEHVPDWMKRWYLWMSMKNLLISPRSKMLCRKRTQVLSPMVIWKKMIDKRRWSINKMINKQRYLKIKEWKK